MENKFKEVSANENNPKWENMIKRDKEIYKRKKELRSEFERDYTRIINCNAYRRLKHKTQVFFSPESDHICTRLEHVMHVESISYTIARYLGLNTELTKAIATAHDIGHSPFGHEGERILSQISKSEIGETFWHEKNGLDYVEKIELLSKSIVLTEKICGSTNTSLGKHKSKLANIFCASGDSNPPQHFAILSFFLSNAITLYFLLSSLATVAPAGPKPIIATSYIFYSYFSLKWKPWE